MNNCKTGVWTADGGDGMGSIIGGSEMNSITKIKSRHLVLALLFVATTINSIDRSLIGLLKPTLSHQLGWTAEDYASIVFWFNTAYAISYLGLGRIIDWIGVRLGFAGAVLLWSVGAALHGLVSTVTGFASMRFVLGLGEGGYLPGCIKTTRLWFPGDERGFSSGVFNAGVTLGALLTPAVMPFLVIALGWRATFIISGLAGLVWLVPWMLYYRDPHLHPGLDPAEHALITAGDPQPQPQTSWRELLSWRATWAYTAIQFLTSPVWWFYLFWMPDFLNSAHGINLARLGPPLVSVYVIAMLGSLFGGTVSSRMIKGGMQPLKARKLTMLICLIGVFPVVFAGTVQGLWAATLLVGLAAAGHQGWAANMFTLPGDVAPQSAVGALAGFGGAIGAVGGMFVAKLVGFVLTVTHNSYTLLFMLVPAAYVLAILLLQILLSSPAAFPKSVLSLA